MTNMTNKLLHIDGIPEKIDREVSEMLERMVTMASQASCISAVEPEIGDAIAREVALISEALKRIRDVAEESEHYSKE